VHLHIPTHERDLKCDEVCGGQDEASVLHLISSIMFESKPKVVALQGLQHLAEMLHRILDSPSSDLDWS
jgi:hypothetical protein